MVPPEMKLACDFCLMPSRDEPFGYVDIEFAWFGAAVIGALRGGLAKLPGFYYVILNAGSTKHIEDALKRAITAAMECDSKVLHQMSLSARRSSFPVADWQEELKKLYHLAQQSFKVQQARKPTTKRLSKKASVDDKLEPLLGDSTEEPQLSQTLGMEPRQTNQQKGAKGMGLPTIQSLGALADALGPDGELQGDQLPDELLGPVGLGDFDENSMPLGMPGLGNDDQGQEREDDCVSLISVETSHLS
jgi:hypothetical protein